MLGKNAHLEHLARIPLFTGCSKKELQVIAKASTEVKVPKGTVLFEQGEPGREAYVIVEGSASVRRNGRRVASLGPGAVVGELALLDHGPRTATVEADGDVVALVVSAREFLAVLDQAPGLTTKVLRELATRVRELDRQVYG